MLGTAFEPVLARRTVLGGRECDGFLRVGAKVLATNERRSSAPHWDDVPSRSDSRNNFENDDLNGHSRGWSNRFF